MKKISVILFWIVFVFVGFFVVRGIVNPGFFPMHDDTQPTRIFLMKEALVDGQFPVRWVEHLGYGYGYPIFNFYAPFPYYLGALVSFIGLDAIDSAKLLFILVTSGSFITMYLLLKQFVNQYGSLGGAVIYTLFPYHAVNTYVRGALSEQFGYLFLPLVLLSYLKITSTGKKSNFLSWGLILGASGALVLISHNLSAIIIAISLSPIVIFQIFLKKYRKMFLIQLAFALICAIGLSSFYLLPMIFESRYTNVGSQVGGGADFRDHFVCVKQFWTGLWGFGGSTPDCNDGMSYRLGKANIVFFSLSALYGIFSIFVEKKKKETVVFYVGITLTIVALFFTLPLSKTIWENVPALEFIQYPWRFLTIAGIGMSLVIGYGISQFSSLSKKIYLGLGVLLFVICITLINNAKLFKPQIVTDKNLGHYTSEESIRYEISKISDEYMPKHFQKPTTSDRVSNGYLVPSNYLNVLNVSSSSKKIEARIGSEKTQNILLNLAPYPSWEFFIDGQKVQARESANGTLIPISQGEHIVTAKFQQTGIQMIGNFITILTIFSLGAVIMKKLYGKKTS